METNKLYDILQKHFLWTAGKEGGQPASFENEDLRYAVFMGAELNGVLFRNCDLRWANFRYADLQNADFTWANLKNADFRGADLTGAHFKYTDMSLADLRYTNLDHVDKARTGEILTEPIKGFKKCQDGVIVELEIPEGAVVFSINNDKCRTNKAIVKKVYGTTRAYSWNHYMTYYEGDVINIKNFNLIYNVECSNGIHFFKTKKEAEAYCNL